MGLTVTPGLYGPTPLHLDQGEQAVFQFQVAVTPGSSYTTLSASVQIYDGNGNLVRTLETPVTPDADGNASVSLAWDGNDDTGHPVPPGEYAPTFTATGT